MYTWTVLIMFFERGPTKQLASELMGVTSFDTPHDGYPGRIFFSFIHKYLKFKFNQQHFFVLLYL